MTKEQAKLFNAFIDEGINLQNETYFIKSLIRVSDRPVFELRVGKYKWDGVPYESSPDVERSKYFLLEIPETSGVIND